METRERMFFGVSNMTAWKFVGINILNILNLFNDKKIFYGREIQQLFWSLSGNTWLPGNDLIYTVLNTYEKEEYLKSYWDSKTGDNKKHIRYYKITDSGINYLNSERDSFTNTLDIMKEIFTNSLILIWGDIDQQQKSEKNRLISSTTFTTLNVLNYMNSVANKKLSVEANSWVYGKEIQKDITKLFNWKWRPSDGVLYPLLSNLEAKEYIKSKWSDNNEKKRSIRLYSITNRGQDYFSSSISCSSGLKNKIIMLNTLCTESIDKFSENGLQSIQKIIKAVV